MDLIDGLRQVKSTMLHNLAGSCSHGDGAGTELHFLVQDSILSKAAVVVYDVCIQCMYTVCVYMVCVYGVCIRCVYTVCVYGVCVE